MEVPLLLDLGQQLIKVEVCMECTEGQVEMFYEFGYCIFFSLRVYADDLQFVGGEVS